MYEDDYNNVRCLHEQVKQIENIIFNKGMTIKNIRLSKKFTASNVEFSKSLGFAVWNTWDSWYLEYWRQTDLWCSHHQDSHVQFICQHEVWT